MATLGDEELLAEMRSALDGVQAAAERVRRRVREQRTSVEDKDKLLTVTVGGHGELAQIAFNGDAYRRLAPAELAELIVATARTAREGAQRKAMAGTAELTGDLAGLGGPARNATSMDELIEGIVRMVTPADGRRGWEEL